MKPSIRLIGHVTAQHFGLRLCHLQMKSRAMKYAYPRAVATHLMRHMIHATTTEIGQFFQRDHTTIVHADERIRCGAYDHLGAQAVIHLLRPKIMREHHKSCPWEPRSKEAAAIRFINKALDKHHERLCRLAAKDPDGAVAMVRRIAGS